ncbi:MAG: response regulator [Candidatus Sulfotelmatobacter sp.]|jgi:DNA-binding response OmpR family regulator
MVTNSTLLCIHKDPAQLSSLREQGYDLVTATNGSEGLRLFMSRTVDAIVVEYHLGLLDGATIATSIKQVRPEVPIIMLADNLELPDGALNSVDAVVTKADGAHFLWATVHFVLNVKPTLPQERKGTTEKATRLSLIAKSGNGLARRHQTLEGVNNERENPFSPRVWRGIRDGTIQF